MDLFVYLFALAISMEVARWLVRMIEADGYGQRPPPESHCDPFPGRQQL